MSAVSQLIVEGVGLVSSPVRQVSAPVAPPPPLCGRAARCHDAQNRRVCPAAQTPLSGSFFVFDSSPWAPWPQRACFIPPCSPTTRSPPTPCRRTCRLGTEAHCRTRRPGHGACSSRSRWDWQKSPLSHARTGPPHTTPCQVNKLFFCLRCTSLLSFLLSSQKKMTFLTFWPGFGATGSEICVQSCHKVKRRCWYHLTNELRFYGWSSVWLGAFMGSYKSWPSMSHLIQRRNSMYLVLKSGQNMIRFITFRPV